MTFVGVCLFAKMPNHPAGKTKLKLPGLEAELPVATLVPMVLGVALMLAATQVPETSLNIGPEPANSKASPVHPDKVASCVASADVSLAELKWGPADCSDPEGAPVRIGTCAEHRPLSWLKQQIALLRDAGVQGFADVPSTFELEPADAYGKKNNRLWVVESGAHLYTVGVGYNINSGAKDGCLSLTKDAKAITPFVCMDTSAQWWFRRGTNLCPVSHPT